MKKYAKRKIVRKGDAEKRLIMSSYQKQETERDGRRRIINKEKRKTWQQRKEPSADVCIWSSCSFNGSVAN